MKKLLLFLLICFFSIFPLINSASISNYTVPSTISLNRNLTIYGVYSDGNSSSDILCSFYVFDLKDQNQVLLRLTDNYTASDGSFYADWVVKEPLFRRGSDYNALSVCGTVQASSGFQVLQKEDIIAGITAESIAYEFKFWTDSNNSLTVVLLIMVVLAIGGIAGLAWHNYTRVPH